MEDEAYLNDDWRERVESVDEPREGWVQVTAYVPPVLDRELKRGYEEINQCFKTLSFGSAEAQTEYLPYILEYGVNHIEHIKAQLAYDTGRLYERNHEEE